MLIGVEFLNRAGRVIANSPEDRDRSRRSKRRTPRAHCVHQTAQAEQIAAGIDRETLRLLGRHELRRPDRRAMLREARRRSHWRRRLLLVCADLTRIPLAAASIDLIFTNLSLQWCNDLGQAFNEFRRVLRPGGTLLFSTFGPDTLTELRQAWSAVDGRTHVNDFTDMHLVGDALLGAGFQQPVMDAEQLTLTYSSVAQLLNELKGLGAHNLTRQRNHALTGRRRLKAMIDAYQSFCRDDRYPASWEVVYGMARAPAEGQPIRTGEGETATFSIDYLRRGKR